MSDNLTKIQQALRNNRNDLAFIVGNGINRFAYGDRQNVSWNGLLLEVWQQISYRTMSDISSGISLTEFYDIMEMEAGSIDKVRQKVVDLLGEWRPDEYHKWLQEKISSDWDVPLLTTNFDMNLNEGLTLNKLESENLKFADYYPWNVYFSRTELNSPTEGFGVWHINGMLKYKRSIRSVSYTHLFSDLLLVCAAVMGGGYSVVSGGDTRLKRNLNNAFSSVSVMKSSASLSACPLIREA